MRVIECRTKQLAARQILVDRRNSPFDNHLAGVHRLGMTKPWQCRAVGAQQKHRLDQVAPRLLDGERSEFRIVKRALAHHPVNRERQLACNLFQRQARHTHVSPAAGSKQAVSIGDSGFATFDSNIHFYASARMRRVLRGSAATQLGPARIRSTPRGKAARLTCHCASKCDGIGAGANDA